MKRISLFFVFISMSMFAFSQTVIVNEDFEGSSTSFTSYAASNPFAFWNTNSVFSTSGSKSYRGVVTFNDTLFLESNSFSTMGYLSVGLSFNQICKIGSLDKAHLQYSLDNGITWIYLTTNEYLGTGLFTQNLFSSRSYADWLSSQPTTLPNNTWWKNETFDISATANNSQVKIRLVLVDGDFNGPASNYGWLIDDFQIVGAACELLPPTLSNATVITGATYSLSPTRLSIDAFDQSGISSAKVYFTINNGTIDSVSLSNVSGNTWTGNLPSGSINDTICYYYSIRDASTCFNQEVLPASQCYQFYIDPLPPVPCIGTAITNYPYNEDFTTFLVGTSGALVNNWQNSTSDDFDWYVHTGATTSTNTGPSSDHTGGNGKYLYMEATGPLSGEEAHLITPCYTLGSNSFYQFSFWYHMYGVGMGELHVDLFANNMWNLDIMPSIAGDQGNQWLKATIDVSNYAGQTIKFRFRGLKGPSFTSDIALDDIGLNVTTGEDVSVASISNPMDKTCLLNPSQRVDVSIFNNGFVPISSIPVAYQLNNDPVVRSTFTSSILPSSSQMFTFSTPITVTPNVQHTLKIWTELSTDINTANDTLTYNFAMNSTVSSFPFTELFDQFTVGAPGILINGWENDQQDDMDWNVNTGGTPSANTGPSQDHNSIGGGNYMYIETSNTPQGYEAYLISPCIDLSNVLAPQLNFWYHMYGATMGALHVDIWSNGAWVLDVMPIISGNQGNVWKNQIVNLSTYANQIIKVRFRGEVGSSFTSDIAIDEVTLTNLATIDISLNSLSSPINQGCQTALNQNVSLNIQNFSNVTLTNIPLAFQNNGGITYRDTLSGPLAPFASQNFTFTNQVVFQPSMNNFFRVWLEEPLDLNPFNDTLVRLISTNGIVNQFPNNEDFDGFFVGAPGTLLNGWENELAADNHDWYVNSGATPTALTGPVGDHTNLNGNYMYIKADGNSGKSARLLSPCFDLSSTNKAQLSFWYHMLGSDMGSLHVDIIINGFYVQDIIQPISGNQGQSWLNQTIDLSGYSGTIRIVFRGDVITKSGTIAGDIAIDDIEVSDVLVGLNTYATSNYVGEIYPNPTARAAYIALQSSLEQTTQIKIMDMKGQLIQQSSLNLGMGKQTVELPIDNLKSGIYLLQLSMGNDLYTRKLIVH